MTKRKKPDYAQDVLQAVRTLNKRINDLGPVFERIQEVDDCIRDYNHPLLGTKVGPLTNEESLALHYVVRQSKEEATRTRVELNGYVQQMGEKQREFDRKMRVIARFMNDFLALKLTKLKRTKAVLEMRAFAEKFKEDHPELQHEVDEYE